jgi:excisionase family DNA binding protein
MPDKVIDGSLTVIEEQVLSSSVRTDHRPEDLLTMEEAARILRCSKAHVSNILNGKVQTLQRLPSVRIGRRTLIRRESLTAWMKVIEQQ